ncbi:MAG: bifunctional phosphoglucose/phosphomannose isomerase [Candidatus Harrisonbacteria bacterium RIFCSPLOWO2_02_FULL_45_10c]|uniref:Bifunctional phosphoglucose/phosphomannose isomerase n=1 Tax=Candidatus Harrisonbacteria bacterium RIFCSPLOWO2_02_FULL_45_10c TaxID=1798410 RepID=A0A1G1ZU11_9BACT|nr:MAG: bifunctional phosphoglucose/phosphomannose isomerase [Candidatus Harrisonbacteria bacterium RIFCSPLOWO2_02_FULL_45_10c]
MMRQEINSFPKQFSFEPKLANAGGLKKFSRVVVAGMGGSNLAAGLIKILCRNVEIIAHRSYGLPHLKSFKDTLIIANSYSGNTEETVDAYKIALKKKLPVAVIATGGTLLQLAKKNATPYIQMPDIGLQPRMALGLNLMAHLKFIDPVVMKKLKALERTLDVARYEAEAKILVKKLRDKIPIIYASAENQALAYIWKIKFNETSKIPAFYNAFPELNHNEMNGFDAVAATRQLSANAHFIFLRDANDHPKIQKRMRVTEVLYGNRALPVMAVDFDSRHLHSLFGLLVYGDWVSYYLAEYYGVEAEQVPMVEEFKKKIKS